MSKTIRSAVINTQYSISGDCTEKQFDDIEKRLAATQLEIARKAEKDGLLLPPDYSGVEISISGVERELICTPDETVSDSNMFTVVWQDDDGYYHEHTLAADNGEAAVEAVNSDSDISGVNDGVNVVTVVKHQGIEVDTPDDNPRLVIDRTGGELKVIRSNVPIDLVVLDYDQYLVKDAIDNANVPDDLQLVPADIEDFNVVEECGQFESFTTEVEEDYVNEVHDYVGDKRRVNRYSRLAMEFYKNQVDEAE